MITALVEFQLPADANNEAIKAQFTHIAPTFYDIPGLIRKCFLVSENGKQAGGVYLWISREAAECFYNESFSQAIAEKFGSIPSITYFETPVVVDNLNQMITTT